LTTVLLLIGYACVRRKKIIAHKTCMLAAAVVAAAFLTSYLIYHYHAGSVRFTGQGIVRPIYFTILISHTILAASLPVMVSLTLIRALRRQFERHRRIARWTLPIWLYVSVTGIVVYLMLYHWFPPFAS
ncbi:MAG: DUF420 domain-containing protein, partial [Phycisphaerae bacterium]